MKRQLHDGLFLAAAEQSEHAVDKSEREVGQRPHGQAILRDRDRQNESENTNRPAVSSVDGR